MRGLKFRAWSGETKSFEYFDLYEGTECGLTNLQIWARNNPIEQPIEQYTGLKDQNGKEIYEGDIVEAGGRTYEVAWFEKDGGWFCFRENDSVYTPLYHLRSEVIGNIHENGELLEEK